MKLRLEILAFGLAALAGPAAGQAALTRVSVDSTGAEADADSGYFDFASFSGDGRYVGFTSDAENLVAGDTNGTNDCFVHDRVTGVTVRVSVGSNGTEANDDGSYSTGLSQDGRFVVFSSNADNLVANDTNDAEDVFVHDRDPDGNGVFDEGNGATTRVSVDSSGVEGNDDCGSGAISADGQLVAFGSYATNLVPNDTNRQRDVFVHDRTTGVTTRVSVDSSGAQSTNGPSFLSSFSPNGSFVVIVSLAYNLVPNDTNGESDVFVHDRATGITTRVSVDSSGLQANSWSSGASISADGRFVGFDSDADNLVAGDTNQVADVFFHDRQTGATTRISVDSQGVEANRHSYDASISADGSRVAFWSFATNLAANDARYYDPDIFVHEVATGTTTIVSAICGIPGDSDSQYGRMSSDGTLVAFGSAAGNLVPADFNYSFDIFVRDLTVSEPEASWSNYGAGFPGTLGVPTLTASADPVLGTTIDVDVGNSLGSATLGVVLAGFTDASIPTSKGGTLLVDQLFLVLGLPLAADGIALAAEIPADPAYCGLEVYAQVLELDDGALKGLSFTAGLELVLGM